MGLVLLALLSSCNDNNDPPLTNMDRLTRKHWSGYVKTEVLLEGHTELIPWETPNVCREDDTIIYLKGGTYTDDVGADDCDGYASTSGIWGFKEGDKVLSITRKEPNADGALDYTIAFPDENTLVLTDFLATACCFDTNNDQIGDTMGRLVWTYKAKP
jgi:hypothetical protein